MRNIKRTGNSRIGCDCQRKIYPSRKCIFFEKKINLSGCKDKLESPWFFIGKSDTITFFVCNEDIEDITIRLENSPDAIISIEDAQTICVHPGQAVSIIPYKFSKFIRLAANSNKNNINCTIWFQTQLKGN